MTKKFETIQSNKPPQGANLRSYIIGFVASLALTIAAFSIAQKHVDSNHSWGGHSTMTLAILTLAMTQLVVQLVFFLHLGQEKKPRLQLLMFLFAGLIILIVVTGSLWIMANLDYSHAKTDHTQMNSTELDKTLIEDEGIYR